jgi:Arm DNA-binding domain
MVAIFTSAWRQAARRAGYSVSPGEARDAGLGSYPTVSLVRAHQEAERCRRLLAEGVDPIVTRTAQRHGARLKTAKARTFEECARKFIATRELGWRNDKTGLLLHAAFKRYV